jgi:aldehyde dehydrogenase (NAD+)
MAAEKVTEFTAGNGVKCHLRTQCFINNEYVDAESGKTFETVNPANEEVIAHIASGDKADVDKAVKAARAAFDHGPWSKMGGADRARLMFKLADILEKNFEELTAIEVTDNGKPYNEYSKADMPMVIQHIRYYAGWADKIMGETFNMPGQHVYTRKEPIGVAGQIIPWNFPLLMFAWKIGPALAAGCTIVLKPAEQTPLGALRMGDFIREAGFPPGVVNIVPGFGETAGAAVSEHMDIDKVAFTGSVSVGKLVMQAAARSNLKKVTLELGGKSPLIIFEDSDLDHAVELSHQAIFFNQGQVCTAGSRVFVQDSIYDKFIEKAKVKAEARVASVGDPFGATTVQGAQVSEEQYNTIMRYIDHGKKEARLVCGGARHGEKGYFIQPTIFADVQSGMKIHDEEIFGPVLSVVKFSDLNDGIIKGNDTAFGLAAAVITKDINKALQVAHKIRAGTVWVNTYHVYSHEVPFGGFKQSGLGREKGFDAINNYLETKSVFIQYE